ncbi:hypothetical protein MWH30_12435 [Fuchsiella alkaliacetigena]|nr:hypothetical protein [Fuchsiella alkaliacetigena]
MSKYSDYKYKLRSEVEPTQKISNFSIDYILIIVIANNLPSDEKLKDYREWTNLRILMLCRLTFIRRKL